MEQRPVRRWMRDVLQPPIWSARSRVASQTRIRSGEVESRLLSANDRGRIPNHLERPVTMFFVCSKKDNFMFSVAFP
jgi:hypothetical protein